MMVARVLLGLLGLGVAASGVMALGQHQWGGLVLVAMGLALAGTPWFERRYRSTQAPPLGAGWAATGEVFRDEEKGEWLEVWFNAASGERRYVPRSHHAA
jgi:hypothetical protein